MQTSKLRPVLSLAPKTVQKFIYQIMSCVRGPSYVIHFKYVSFAGQHAAMMGYLGSTTYRLVGTQPA
eukprot:scaffold198_cov28-Prasinocladus_malaysianus.AAC.1